MLDWRTDSRVLALCCAVSLSPSLASAAGFLFYEVGAPEVGLASAGYTTRAASPSTLLANPAGMTQLQGTQVQVGSVLVYGHLRFAPDSQTDPGLGTNDGGNAVGLLPSGGAFATFAPSPNLRAGVGIFTNFGAPESWDPAWLGRYYTTKTTLLGISIMPAVAWRIQEALSVGAAVNVMSGHLRQEVAIRNVEPQSADGKLEVSSNTWGVGANFGLLWSPQPTTRLGVTYTSPVSLNFSSEPSFSGLGPVISAVLAATGLDTATLDLGMKVPQTLMLGFSQRIDDCWTLMGDVGWQNWAAFGAVEIGLTTSTDPKGLTTHINYRDTWHVGLGAQVRLSEPWKLSFGAAYDSSMTSDENRSLSLALANQLRLGVGAELAIDRHWDIAFSTELLLGGSPRVDVDRGPLAGHVSGSYAGTWLLFGAFSFTWKS